MHDLKTLEAATRALAEAEYYYKQATLKQNAHVADKFIAYGNAWLAEAIRLTSFAQAVK